MHQVRKRLRLEDKQKLKNFLQNNLDVFALKHEDMWTSTPRSTTITLISNLSSLLTYKEEGVEPRKVLSFERGSVEANI